MKYETLNDVVLNDPSVNCIRAQGGSLEQCIVELANQKRELVEKIMELESMAPRKYLMPDGRTLVWRCPDELIPLTTMLPNPPSRLA